MLNLKRINILVFILCIPSLILASENLISESDFFYRVFNFSIFAALLYYLAANPIKDFFILREKDIEKTLTENRERLIQARKDENIANANLEKVKDTIIQKIYDANEKVKYIEKDMFAKNQIYLNQLEKQFLQNIKIEQNKMIQNTIRTLFDKNILLEDITLNNSQVVKILENRNKDN